MVTVTPDTDTTEVLSRGICGGLNGYIPISGHVDPNLVVGDSFFSADKKCFKHCN